MRNVFLLAWVVLLSCVRNQSPAGMPAQDDKSIVFPDFFQAPVVVMGEPDKVYALDGVTLSAVMIAWNDFFIPSAEDRPCWEKPEAHGVRVIRQGDVVFVYIHADLARCGHQVLMLDGGAKYAIGVDGRILRRVLGGEPEEAAAPESPDAGDRRVFEEPGFSTILKPPGHVPAYHLPPEWLDGGVSPAGGVAESLDGGL
ncbi:MAG: hypothetical protein JXB05_29285 [Myxococcaceae bacterium]|nr:hypothetical protein [Myxococcaceae bacterium]